MQILQSIENNVLPLVVTFIVAACGVGLYNMEYESFFSKRRNIDYQTFNLYSKMFNVHVNYINVGCIATVLIYSMVLFGLFITSNVVRIYAFAVLPFDAMMILFLYEEITRPKYNVPSIDIFVAYRKDVEDILSSKEKTLNRIETIETTFINETTKIKQNLVKFNNILPNPSKMRECDDFLEEKLKEIKYCKEELTNYNEAIIKQFNDNLTEFLKQGLSPDFEILKYDAIDMNELKKYVFEYKNIVEEYINSYLIVGLKNGSIKKAEEIIEVLEIGKAFGVSFTNEDMLDILNIVNVNIENKPEVADYLFINKYITEDNFFGQIIQRDWAWCITETTVKTLTRKQLTEGYLKVIECNAKNCCNVFLQNKDIDQTDILDTVLSSTTINNACTQAMNFHKFIMNNVQEFDDESTKYENMAQSLKENGSTQIKSIIIPICEDESYYDNRNIIENEYKLAYDAIRNKYSRLGVVLMSYYDGILAENEYVDSPKLMKFYMENIKTLNKSALKYFNILLCSVVIVYEVDKKKIKNAINSLKEDMDINQYDFSTDITAKESAKKIIKNILKNNTNSLIPIVNRIEKIPLSLDKLNEI